MAYYTIPQIINIAKASQLITSKWSQEGVLWNNGNLDPMRPYILQFVRRRVEYYYNHNPTFDGLYEVALFLFGLCPVQAFGYGNGGGGGSVTPTVPVGGYIYTALNDTIIADSQTYTNILLKDGKDLGVIIVNDQVYSASKGDFTFNPSAPLVTFVNISLFADDTITLLFNQKI